MQKLTTQLTAGALAAMFLVAVACQKGREHQEKLDHSSQSAPAPDQRLLLLPDVRNHVSDPDERARYAEEYVRKFCDDFRTHTSSLLHQGGIYGFKAYLYKQRDTGEWECIVWHDEVMEIDDESFQRLSPEQQNAYDLKMIEKLKSRDRSEWWRTNIERRYVVSPDKFYSESGARKNLEDIYSGLSSFISNNITLEQFCAWQAAHGKPCPPIPAPQLSSPALTR